MKSAIPLEHLLPPLKKLTPHVRSEFELRSLAELIRKGDVSVLRKLEKIAEAAYKYWWDIYENGGGVSDIMRYAWLRVEMGNYYRALGKHKLMVKAYRDAYSAFMDPVAGRGHDVDAYNLLRDNPELRQVKKIAGEYKQLSERFEERAA